MSDKLEMLTSILEAVSNKATIETFAKIISNIHRKPDEKFRKLKLNNQKLQSLLFSDDNINLCLDVLGFEKCEMEGDECMFLSYSVVDPTLFENLDNFLTELVKNFDNRIVETGKPSDKITLNNNINLDRILWPFLSKTTWREYNLVEFNKNYKYDIRFLLTDEIKAMLMKYNESNADILFNFNYLSMNWLSTQYNLVYGYDSNNLKSLKKFIDKFHKLYNGEYPEILETKLRTMHGDTFWKQCLDSKTELLINDVLNVLFENKELHNYELYSKIFEINSKDSSKGYVNAHNNVIKSMYEYLSKRYDIYKNGLIGLRELDFILINLKFDKLFFEKIYFDICRSNLLNSHDYYMYFYFHKFMKLLKQNGITKLDALTIESVKAINKLPKSTVEESLGNDDKLKYLQSFIGPHNDSETYINDDVYICPLNDYAQKHGFGFEKKDGIFYVGYFENDVKSSQGIIFNKSLGRMEYGLMQNGFLDSYHLERDLHTRYDLIGDFKDYQFNTEMGCIISYDQDWKPKSFTRSSFFQMDAYGYTQVHNIIDNTYNEFFINANRDIVFGYRMRDDEYDVGYIKNGYYEEYRTDVIRKGMHIEGVLDGWCCEINLNDSSVYEGTFVRGRREGYGQMIKEGDVYLGIFQGDNFNEVAYQEYGLKFEHILMI